MTSATARIVEEADVQRLVEAFPEKPGSPLNRHVKRYRLQQSGDVTSVAAWRDGLPVGYLFVAWPGGRGERTPQADELGCAEVNDLYVAVPARGQGTGRLLMEVAEECVSSRGMDLIGLEGTAANPIQDDARDLYRNLGYVDAGHGEFVSGYTYYDTDGKAHRDEESYVYLTKKVSPS